MGRREVKGYVADADCKRRKSNAPIKVNPTHFPFTFAISKNLPISISVLYHFRTHFRNIRSHSAECDLLVSPKANTHWLTLVAAAAATAAAVWCRAPIIIYETAPPSRKGQKQQRLPPLASIRNGHPNIRAENVYLFRKLVICPLCLVFFCGSYTCKFTPTPCGRLVETIFRNKPRCTTEWSQTGVPPATTPEGSTFGLSYQKKTTKPQCNTAELFSWFVRFRGSSIWLGGQIGVNFFFGCGVWWL